MLKYDGNVFRKFNDTLIQSTLNKPVFRVFGDYLKCFKYFNNIKVQGNINKHHVWK